MSATEKAAAERAGDVAGLKPKYEISAKMRAQIACSFTYHKPQSDQPSRYCLIRDMALEFAEVIAELSPTSREQSLAITNLEQAVMWANAAIARNENFPE